MPEKANPLKLNMLQLKTLAILQELARHRETSTADEARGERLITLLPQPHGDHIHVGRRVALTRDASGLWNQAVWIALERKGLARGNFPVAIALTPAGIAYDTGPAGRVLHGSDH
ncbi:MAG: hypothetical protein FJX68_19165 [Alphaproteobacteria bacterium]|nr:hypothetical protein [Alphaproteobacteria bacterium]